AEAQRIMTVLRQNDITDTYIVPSDDGTNNLSLGVFSEPERAQHRAAQIRALGFPAQIADRTHRGPVYWLDVDSAPGQPPAAPTDLQADQQANGRILRLQVQSCPGKIGEG